MNINDVLMNDDHIIKIILISFKVLFSIDLFWVNQEKTSFVVVSIVLLNCSYFSYCTITSVDVLKSWSQRLSHLDRHVALFVDV